MTSLVKSLQDVSSKLEHEIADESASTPEDECRRCCDVILPSLLTLRETVDTLEQVVADDVWPSPTYQEMLFIK